MNQDVYVVIEHLRGQVSDISYMMLAAAKALTKQTGGNVVAILLGHNAKDLANHLAADHVLYVDHPALANFTSETYLSVLTDLINQEKPRAVVMGHTSIGSDVASGISIRLNLPIVSQTLQFSGENDDHNVISKICGGKILTESRLPQETSLVTMIPGGYKPEEGKSETGGEVQKVSPPSLENLRINLTEYLEPETSDVDISKEEILVSVGRGIQTEDNIELAEELAELLGGVVCASRPVVDQGWLPTSRMVGKSGKSVKPKLYLAFGISGAPEHVEGLTDGEMIIAVNIDPSAPIFDVAQYGVEMDLFDLIDELILQAEEA